MDSFGLNKRKYFESLGASPSHLTPSIEKPPSLEEKPLLAHLRYAYLEDTSTLPIIILSALSNTKEGRLLRVLKEQKEEIKWSLVDIKGIRSSMSMHIILLEAYSKPSVDAQRRLNLTMKEVVRKEVLKWLDAMVESCTCSTQERGTNSGEERKQ